MIMNLRIVGLICLFLVGSSFNDVKLVKRKVADGITVMLPSNFHPMSANDLRQRYPSVRKPIAAYTNDQRLVDFSINLSASRWRSSDIEIAKSFIKASIYNMFDNVTVIQEDIREINDHQYIIFEIETRLNGTKGFTNSEPLKKYSYLQYLIINNKMIVFSFHSPVQLKDQWQTIVPDVMNSIKVNKKKI
jgi:hypothetical protein